MQTRHLEEVFYNTLELTTILYIHTHIKHIEKSNSILVYLKYLGHPDVRDYTVWRGSGKNRRNAEQFRRGEARSVYRHA